MRPQPGSNLAGSDVQVIRAGRLRIGWIATKNERVLTRMAALKDYTTICSSAPSEYLAELALRHREQIAGRNLQLIHHNLSLLETFFARTCGQVYDGYPRKPARSHFHTLLGKDIEEFCHSLVSEAGVLLLPGTMYDHPGNHFRLGFARRNMPDALRKLEESPEIPRIMRGRHDDILPIPAGTS